MFGQAFSAAAAEEMKALGLSWVVVEVSGWFLKIVLPVSVPSPKMENSRWSVLDVPIFCSRKHCRHRLVLEMMIFSHYFTAHLLTRGVFLSTQLSYHGKPASFSFRYHPKHGGSLSHARGVAQEIQPIFRCSNGAEDVHPYQSEDDTHRYSLDVQKKGENYLTIFASQQSMITCFFFGIFNPTWGLWDVQTPQQTLGDLPGNCWQLRNIQGQKRLEEAVAVDVILFVAGMFLN